MSTFNIPPLVNIFPPPTSYFDEAPPEVTEQRVAITAPNGDMSVHDIHPGMTRILVQPPPRPGHSFSTHAPFTIETLSFDIPPPGANVTTPEGYTIQNLTPTRRNRPRETQARPLGILNDIDPLRRVRLGPDQQDIYADLRYQTDLEAGRRLRERRGYSNGSTMTTGGMSTPSTMTPERLIEFLKENIEIRTKLTLDGTDLTFRTQMIVRHNNQETIVSDDEDSVDLDGLLDHL